MGTSYGNFRSGTEDIETRIFTLKKGLPNPSPCPWNYLPTPQNGSFYGSTVTISSGSQANTGAAESRPPLALRHPPTALHARPLVRRGVCLPRRDRCPRRAPLAATDVHSGRHRQQITAQSPVSVLGSESEPHSGQRSCLRMSNATDGRFNAR